MAAQTPEELNAQLLARIVGLEQQVVQLSARAGVGRPQLPNADEIRRVGYAAHQALRKIADNAEAEQLATKRQRRDRAATGRAGTGRYAGRGAGGAVHPLSISAGFDAFPLPFAARRLDQLPGRCPELISRIFLLVQGRHGTSSRGTL